MKQYRERPDCRKIILNELNKENKKEGEWLLKLIEISLSNSYSTGIKLQAKKMLYEMSESHKLSIHPKIENGETKYIIKKV